MGIGYNPKIVTNGLLGHWDAGNTKSYPGSGTTWTDLIGKIANNGVTTSTPTYNSSFGGYFNFASSSTSTGPYFPLANDLFTATANFSIIMWGRWNTYDNSTRIRCFSLVLGSTLIQFGYLEATTYSNSLYVRITNPVGNSTFISRSNESIDLGSWSMYSLSCIGTSASFYKNTTLLTTISGNVPSQNNTYSGIGGAFISLTGGNSPIGDIATASYYNVALSSDEILQNYNALRGRFGL